MGFPILSVIFLSPLVGCFVILMLHKDREKLIKLIAVVATGIPLLLSFIVLALFKGGTAQVQFEESFYWVKALGISYYLGVDGLNLLVLLLTTILVFLIAIASFNITHRAKLYFCLLLVSETGLLGVFLFLDLVLFYISWETVLIPTYLLIGIWGGPERSRAAIKFLIYTLIGSLVMLVGFLVIYFQAGIGSFDMIKLAKANIPLDVQKLAFAALFLGFAVKVPLFPFHSWQPDAYTQAPTTITVLLSGVLAKMGAYGFIRVALSLLPEGAHAFGMVVAIIALVNVIFGDLVASAQRDLKRMFAYSSLSHMGFIVLGAFAFSLDAMKGAVFHIFNHGIIAGAIFFLIGIIYQRTKTRQIEELGGLQRIIPAVSGFFWFVCLASFGMPGLSGFVGELWIVLGTFETRQTLAIIAIAGAIIMAGYVFWMLLRINFGSSMSRKELKSIPDLSRGELALLLPLGALIILLGVYPRILMDPVAQSVKHLVQFIKI